MSLDNEYLEKLLYELKQSEELNKHGQYKIFHVILGKESNLNISFIKGLLEVLNRDMCNDADYTYEVLNILLDVLKILELKNEVQRLQVRSLLVKSALTNIKLQTKLNENKTISDSKKILYQVMVNYPAEVYIDLTNDHINHLYSTISKPLKTKCGAKAFNLSLFQDDELDHDALIFELIKKILMEVPNENRIRFVTSGLDTWFSTVVPYAISLMICNLLSKNAIFVEVLNMLIHELADVDYKSNKEWKKILECIINPSGYQNLLKKSLKSGSDNWYLIWCILIRLLKSRTVTKDGPINCLLPVVEIAFKSDFENRCRAFHCWKALAEHFAGDKNSEKRMAFLMIPLQSNNAKVEKVVFAKFFCWWHIIKCFRTKINSTNDVLLMKFLSFCFGFMSNPVYEDLKTLAAQAMLDIVGHDSGCSGCNDPSFPRMTSPILDIALLTFHLHDWKYYLTCTYDVLSKKQDCDSTSKQITCIWKSIFNLVSTMAKNHIRRDLTFGLLETCLDIVKTQKFTEFISNAMCKIFLEGDVSKFISLLECSESDDISSEPLSILFKCFLHKQFNKHLLKSNPPLMEIRPMVEFCFKAYKGNSFFKWSLSQLSSDHFYFWAALCDFILSQNILNESAFDILKWPMKTKAHIQDISLAITTWDKMYKHTSDILSVKENEELAKLLIYNLYPSFNIIVLLNICTHSMTPYLRNTVINNHLKKEWLHNSHIYIEKFFDDLTKDICTNCDAARALNVEQMLNCLIEMFTEEMKKPSHLKKSGIYLLYKSLKNNLEKILEVKYMHPKSNTVATSINMNSDNTPNVIPLTDDIIDLCENDEIIEVTDNKTKLTDSTDQKSLKYNLNNTIKLVVENGENVVVVDSNNKFNPLKLTEHQKEKLQRKRDDIPALYQDLSQSQDEFKKKYWTSLDKSNQSINNVQLICKNKTLDEDKNKINNSNNDNVTHKKIAIITTPSPKSKNRLPLKDRITRNLKLLLTKTRIDSSLETSTPNQATEAKQITDNEANTLNKVIITNKTPRNQVNTFYIVNEQGKNKDIGITIQGKHCDMQKNEDNSNKNTQKKTKMDEEIDVNALHRTDLTLTPHLLEISTPNKITESKKITENKGNTLDKLLISHKSPGQRNSNFYIINEQEKNNAFEINTQDQTKGSRNNETPNKNNETSNKNNETPNKNNKTSNKNNEKNKLNSLHVLSMSTERPLRAKRKPKKFAIEYEDLTKKRRYSLPNLHESTNTSHDIKKRKQKVESCILEKNEKCDDIANITFTEEERLPENNELILKASTSNEDEDITQIEYNDELADNCSLKLANLVKNAPSANIDTAKDIQALVINVQAVPSTLNLEDGIQSVKCLQIVKDTQNVFNTENLEHTQNINNTQNVDVTQNLENMDYTKNVVNTQNIDNTRNVGNDTKNIDDTHNLNDSENVDVIQNVDDTHNVDDTQNADDTRNADDTQNSDDTYNSDDTQNLEHSQIIESDQTAEELVKDTRNVGGVQNLLKQTKGITQIQNSFSSKTLGNKTLSNKINNNTKNNNISLKEKKIKQSRLVKNLAIDMVEGNPFLEKPKTRRTRRSPDTPKKGRRKINNSGIKTKATENKTKKITKDCAKEDIDSEVNINNKKNTTSNEIPLSEDFIESSQDSMISTISIKTRRSIKRQSCTKSGNSAEIPTIKSKTTLCNATIQSNNLIDLNLSELTASMDTEPLLNTPLTNENLTPIIEINTQDKTQIGPETQELAEADTQPVEPSFPCIEIDEDHHIDDEEKTVDEENLKIDTNITDAGCLSSPFKDDTQRNEVFLNNTLDISPIKSMLPKDENETPEKSDDFIVIKLASPVQSNGEPLKDSPEIFTNDKLSPSNNELSPPREASTECASSPLSLKKNRTQLRPTGRAAQMLSLCQPNKLQSLMISDKGNECDDPKKNCVLMSARRNLQILYNMNADAASNDKSDDTSKIENFLKLKRPLPSADSSPIGPILKRKLVEIEDEITISPSSKKKRVSFHDPPVSTTVAVTKYIEICEKSPQHKRDRPQRNYMKSPKQLDTLFKQTLTPIKCNEDVLTKDTEDSGLIESTPLIEVVNVSELNNTEPICPQLINCNDSIEFIASELSSPAMKELFVKELEGKINTVADFAKLTEVEVNRLCMKAPKVQVAKEVLTNYLAKLDKTKSDEEIGDKNDTSIIELSPTKLFLDMEVQTNETVTEDKSVQMNETVAEEKSVQTNDFVVKQKSVQTNDTVVAERSVQTNDTVVKEQSVQTNLRLYSDTLVQTTESSFVSSEDLITSCIKERPDFLEIMADRKELENSLKLSALLPAIRNIVTSDADKKKVFGEVISQEEDTNALQEYLCDKFNSTSLVMFCSNLLKRVHRKME